LNSSGLMDCLLESAGLIFKQQTPITGLKISKLFRDKDGLNTITDNTLVTIQSNIEKIRNVLVHLRESKKIK
jgi:hypothetical protein